MSQNILAQALFEAEIMDASVYDFTLLLEDRIDFIKTKYKGALNSVVDTIAQHIDPTKNKKYTEWLVDRHLKGEDVLDPKVKESLTYFDKAKSTAHDTNIKNHTISSLHDVAHLVMTSPKEKKAGELTELYNKDGVHGFEVPNKETSIALYGPGKKYSANWCTSTPTSNNTFDKYEGGKYTMHFPSGDFLQIHHQTHQTKDPANTEIEFASDARYKPYVGHINEFMKQTADKEKVDHSLPEQHFGIEQQQFDREFNEYKNEGYSKAFMDHAESNRLSDEQFDLLAKRNWHNKLARNPHLSQEQTSKLVDHFTQNIGAAPHQFLSKPALHDQHTDRVFNALVDSGNMHRVASLHNLQPKHVQHLLAIAGDVNHPRRSDAHSALTDIIHEGKYKFSGDEIGSLVRNRVNDHERIGQHQKLPEGFREDAIHELAKHMRSSATTSKLSYFAEHNEIKPHEMHELIDSAEISHHPSRHYNALLNTPYVKQEHIDRIVKNLDKDPDVYDAIFGNTKIPTDTATHLLTAKTTNGETRHIGFDHIRSYLGRRDASAAAVHEMLKHNNPSAIDANDLEAFGFHAKKDLPLHLLSDTEHAPEIAKNLEHHPKLTAQHLDSLIGGVNKWSNERGIVPGNTIVSNILNHPNANAGHFNQIMNEYGGDSSIRSLLENHPRTPPSVHQRLMTEQK